MAENQKGLSFKLDNPPTLSQMLALCFGIMVSLMVLVSLSPVFEFIWWIIGAPVKFLFMLCVVFIAWINWWWVLAGIVLLVWLSTPARC